MKQDDSTGNIKTKKQIYNPATVSPVAFAEKMKEHWESLGNCSSEKLMEQWRRMGDAFSRAVLIGAGKRFDGQEYGQWQVLQPPTGTGKTQGACVYAALVAKQNRGMADEISQTAQNHPKNILNYK